MLKKSLSLRSLTTFLPALHDKKSHTDSIDVALIYGIGDVRIERKSFAELKQLIELAKES